MLILDDNKSTTIFLSHICKVQTKKNIFLTTVQNRWLAQLPLTAELVVSKNLAER
jgi:hypothetical protein